MGSSRSDSNSPALSVGHDRKGLASFFQAFGCIGTMFGVVFCSIFLLFGVIFLTMIALLPMWKIWQAGSWVETPCTILESEVAGGGDTFHVEVSYEYAYQGQTYTGDRYSFSDLSTNGRAGKQAVVDRYPEGEEAVCYVNPQHPEESVLNRSFVPELWWGLFSLPFIGIGLGGFWVVARAKRSAAELQRKLLAAADDLSGPPDRVPPVTASARIHAWTDSEFDDDDLEIPEGPVTLTPESSPVGQFVGCLIVSILFHVFIGIFYATRMEDWTQGQWEWWPDLLAIPAALVSLTCILGVIHAFLGMFNPKPVLTLSRQAVPLGGRVKLQWEFQGSSSSIRSLSFKLEGVEEARYRRGTNTYTDTEEFHEEVVASSFDPLEIAGGEIEIAIPSDTMHSFLGTNNKVKWRLTLRGEIPFWPDVTANFPIRILPHEPVA